MANEFKISFPFVQINAVSSAATSQHASYPHENLWYGGSTLYWKTAASVTQSRITWDMGSGVTYSIDHAILHGLDLMTAYASGAFNVSIRGSTDNFSASDVVIFSKNSITNSDLVGTRAQTLLLEGSVSTA